MVKRTPKMNLCDLLGFRSQIFWFLIIYTQYLACNQFSSCTVLNSNNKATINSQQINITKQFKLNHSLDNKSTYSSLSSSSNHHFTSSLSSSASSSSSSSSSESSQTNEDILATSDVSSSLGAQIGNGGGTLMVVSDELIDNSALETRTDKTDKLDKSKLLIELTTEVNIKQTTSSLISDSLSANDVFSQEDDYLHQHLNEHIDQKLNQQLDQINSHNNLLNDYLITDLQDSKLTQNDNFKHQNDNQNYKLNNEPIIYSSSIVNRDTLDTGHAVFTPIQPPPSSSIDLSSNQQQPPLWNYPLDFSNQHLNDKSHSHSRYNTSNIKHEHVHPEIEEEPLNSKKHSASVVGVCKDGLVVPAWRPLYNLTTYDRVLRGIVYFLALCYLFVGVSIIADRFMGAIEVITSTERDVIIRQSNGETHVISVKIWNETVSNLTLMALGSSAPEILLSIIEVYAQNFDAGPGTIVGSAAFNMFVIIAVCVWVVPCSEVKKIKHLRVYFITMIWSVFAYIWLLLILQYISEGVVEIWEGLLTFIFFPLTVLTAYIADRRLLFYKYIGKKYRANRRGMIVESEGVTSTPSHSHQKPPNSDDVELGQIVANAVNKRKSSNFLNFRNSSIIGSLTGSTNLDGGLKIFDREEDSEEVKEFEQHRREYIQILKRLRKKHPDAAMETLEYMAREEIVKQGPKSRAFYRLQATKKLTGGTPFKRHKDKTQERKDSSSTLTAQSNQKPIKEDNVVYIYFDPAHYTVFENVGSFAVRILREGPLNCEVCVHVKTEDGTANGGSDYIEIDEDVHFARGEEIKEVFIQVIDDDIFEEDEHFYVNLSNARLIVDNSIDNTVNENSAVNDVQSNGHLSKQNSLEQQIPQAHEKPLDQKANATVMILDDDHSGVFSFPETEVEINEAVGLYLLKVVRNSGARGRVFLPFKVLEAGARRNIDFELADGELVFENNETWQEIPIQIIDNESYEKDAIFCVELGEPRRDDDELRTTISASPKSNLSFKEKVALQGKPRLGETRKVQVRIKESKEFKDTVDKLFQKTTTTSLIGSSSWKDQFIEAITIQLDDDDDELDEDGEPKPPRQPNYWDYTAHSLTIVWKVLFAFVPPTEYLNGWLCFWTSIIMIGVLTAIIGDLSSHLGCSVGLKDTITAIAFVALGTSIPDTFASKVAAINDKYADSSIGNVTGSNAVNVFLGIGIAWTMAALVKSHRGERFEVDPGSLGFSVAIFCICAAICCTVLIIRRYTLGGELGGPMKYKFLTTLLLIGLWLIYLFLSSLETYNILPYTGFLKP